MLKGWIGCCPMIVYYSSDDRGGGSGDEDGSDKGSSSSRRTGSDDDEDELSDLSDSLRSLIRRKGSMKAALRQLFSDNYNLREDRRIAREERDQFKGKVPEEGATILTGTQKELWEEVSKLGKAEEVKKKLSERDQFEQELTNHRRSQKIAEVAELTGFKQKVLLKLAGNLDYTVKEVDDTESGEKVKRVFVKDGDKEVDLEQYAEKEWPEFMSSLRGEEVVTTKSPEDTEKGNLPGTFLPRQSSGGRKQSQGDELSSYLGKTYGSTQKKGS